MKRLLRRSLTARLMCLFALLLILFTLVLGVLYNALMERQMVSHHSITMQRNAYAISQNLSELIARPPMTRWMKTRSPSARIRLPPIWRSSSTSPTAMCM